MFFFLEINPNCGIFYPLDAKGSADFILTNGSIDHRAFLAHIIDCAFKRHNKKIPLLKVLYKPAIGYGLYANKDFEVNDVVQANEEGKVFIVSQKHGGKNWSQQQMEMFKANAYPLTDQIWVTWSRFPSEWFPINHSCDSNTWLDNLNLVARRPIRKGEHVTIDFCLFSNEQMTTFTCHCGTARCRGQIKGTDHLEPFVKEMYGDHMTDYVLTKRNGRSP